MQGKQDDMGKNRLSVILILYDNPANEVAIFGPYIRSGDIISAAPDNFSLSAVSQLKKQAPGIMVATLAGERSKDKILVTIPNLPSIVEVIGYDYEPKKGNAPEFTIDQDRSIQNFDQVREAAHMYGKKLMILPVYVSGRHWDWGEVAKHTDILVVQVQNFQTGSTIVQQNPQFSPRALGLDLNGVAKKMVSEVKTKSPSTKIYLQFGFKFSTDPQNMIKDIEAIENIGVDGVLIFQGNKTNGDQKVLQVLKSMRSST
jgi:hypothetical protein